MFSPNQVPKGYRSGFVALIGRPNVGKSSLINRLLGENRSLVSPISGTTRDSLYSNLIYNRKNYRIIDTAGVRRRVKIKENLEKQCEEDDENRERIEKTRDLHRGQFMRFVHLEVSKNSASSKMWEKLQGG